MTIVFVFHLPHGNKACGFSYIFTPFVNVTFAVQSLLTLCLGSIGMGCVLSDKCDKETNLHGHFPIIPLKNSMVKKFGRLRAIVFIRIRVITRCVIKELYCIGFQSRRVNTVKPVLSGHSKEDKKLVLGLIIA